MSSVAKRSIRFLNITAASILLPTGVGMHQVLSYETAVRANSSRDSQDYKTKRTCVYIILVIALLTLTSGYLLGKLLSDRQHEMRILLAAGVNKINHYNENSIELSSADYKNLKQLRYYQQSKDKLLTAARQLSQELQNDNNNNYMPSSLNTEIFNKYISCTQDIPPNTSIESSQFIEELINNTGARQRDCMRIIQVIIDNNLANG